MPVRIGYSLGRVTTRCRTGSNLIPNGNAMRFSIKTNDFYYTPHSNATWARRMRSSAGGGLRGGGRAPPGQRPGINRT